MYPVRKLKTIEDRLLRLLRPGEPATVMSIGQPATPAQYFADLRLACSPINGAWPHSRNPITSPGMTESLGRHIAGTSGTAPRRHTLCDTPPLDARPGAAIITAATRILDGNVLAGTDPGPAEAQAELAGQVATQLQGQSGPEQGPPTWPLYVIAEKILSEGEPLPADWAVDGTTGYDFLNAVNGLFVDGDGREAFDRIYQGFTGAAAASLFALTELVLPALLEQRAIHVCWAGPLLAGFSIAAILGAALYGARGRWPGSVGAQSMAALLVATTFVTLVATVPSLPWIAGSLVIAGLFQAGVQLTRNLSLRAALPARAHAAGYSVLYAATGVGYAGSAILAGAVQLTGAAIAG